MALTLSAVVKTGSSNRPHCAGSRDQFPDGCGLGLFSYPSLMRTVILLLMLLFLLLNLLPDILILCY